MIKQPFFERVKSDYIGWKWVVGRTLFGGSQTHLVITDRTPAFGVPIQRFVMHTLLKGHRND